MNRATCQIPVDGLQIRLLAENDIGGVFALVHAPVVAGCEIAIDRTTQPRQFVEPFVDSLRFPAIGDRLCLLPVSEVRKGVVSHPIFDADFAQLPGQPVVAVQTDL